MDEEQNSTPPPSQPKDVEDKLTTLELGMEEKVVSLPDTIKEETNSPNNNTSSRLKQTLRQSFRNVKEYLQKEKTNLSNKLISNRINKEEPDNSIIRTDKNKGENKKVELYTIGGVVVFLVVIAIIIIAVLTSDKTSNNSDVTTETPTLAPAPTPAPTEASFPQLFPGEFIGRFDDGLQNLTTLIGVSEGNRFLIHDEENSGIRLLAGCDDFPVSCITFVFGNGLSGTAGRCDICTNARSLAPKDLHLLLAGVGVARNTTNIDVVGLSFADSSFIEFGQLRTNAVVSSLSALEANNIELAGIFGYHSLRINSIGFILRSTNLTIY